jgi:hypothetical protein
MWRTQVGAGSTAGQSLLPQQKPPFPATPHQYMQYADLSSKLALFASQQLASCRGSAYNQEHCATCATSAFLPSAGCVTPTSSSAQQSPLRSNTSDLESRMSLTMLRTSPISERFQQAAVQQDLIAEPGSNRGSAAGTAQQERPGSVGSSAAGSVEVAAGVDGDEEAAAAAAGFEVTLHLPDEQHQQQEEDEQQQEEDEQQQQVQPQLQQQTSRRQWSRNNSSSGNRASSSAGQGPSSSAGQRPSSSTGQAPSSRPASAAASRPGSSANSRRSTAEQQVPKRQSSHSLVPATNAAAAAVSELNAAVQQAGAASGVASDAAAAQPLPAQALRRVTSGAGVQRPLSRASSRARTGAGVAVAATGRTNTHLLSVSFFRLQPASCTAALMTLCSTKQLLLSDNLYQSTQQTHVGISHDASCASQC